MHESMTTKDNQCGSWLFEPNHFKKKKKKKKRHRQYGNNCGD